MARRSRRGVSSSPLRVVDSEVAHATGILELHRPVDVHDRAITSGIAPGRPCGNGGRRRRGGANGRRAAGRGVRQTGREAR